MMFARVENGEILETYESLPALKEAFPSAVFLWPLANEDLAPLGLALISIEAEPEGLAPGEYTELGDPTVVDGECIRPRIIVPVTPERLAEHEAALHRQIDIEAGAFRLNFITDVPGQAETYQQKVAEAAEFAGEADPANPVGTYPMLAAEAQATGTTIADLAATVTATRATWLQLGAGIEAMRMGAKKAVSAARAAEDWDAMQAAGTVDWNSLLA